MTRHRAVLRGACSAAVVVAVLAGVTHGLRAAAPRQFPDTSTRIAVLTDQLPGQMTDAQVRFAATHYVGTQKLTLNLSRPLRAINPNFLVLHYHLAMWQSAPNVPFITNGREWANDHAEVSRHESWFWHNLQNERVASSQDGKLLMNVADPGFRQYWRDSLVSQVAAGEYDGVFLDSASPALLQGEARAPGDPRLFGVGVRTNALPELGGKTWIGAWENWIADLDNALAARGIPLIPNVDGLRTTWDNTDYALTAGVFCEGFLDPQFTREDWTSAADQTLALVRRNKIVILQNYLPAADDVARRKFLLASYLLVKGARTYVAYFASTPFEWYPEWDVQFGAAQTTGRTLDDLNWKGIYRRDFEKGVVLINPTARTVHIDLGATLMRLVPRGGGAVSPDGRVTGGIETVSVSTIDIAPSSAEIFMRQ